MRIQTRRGCACIAVIALAATAVPAAVDLLAEPQHPWLIAHRGASAYAPENTIPAFRLAVDQGADFVEFDLRLTRDGKLVCLHDETLERTTDVEEVFPQRHRPAKSATSARTWPLADFTLDEIRRLDAGAWMGERFKGTRVPTFRETIDALRGRAGLFIELKTPERYPGIERLVLEELEAAGLDRPGADSRTPVLIQSFSASSLQILTSTLKTRLPIHFLVARRDAGQWMSPEGLRRIREFATGLSPEKTILVDDPAIVDRSRTAGLPITPYTFRAADTAGFPDVRAEMAHYLASFGVRGVITDNPDHMPRSPRRD